MVLRGFRLNVLAVLSTCVLFACGGSKHEAKGPEGNPWADYKGTYATAGAPRTEAPAKSAKAEPAAKAEAKAKEAAPVEKAEEPALKKASHGTIKGESVSSIGLDAFADASKTAMKSKVVSTKFVVGAQYEEMQVQLKGASVTVVRPAANPASDGPAISAPKTRTGELSKTDSSWYDEEADVLVVVSAAKKPVAQKALGSILKK